MASILPDPPINIEIADSGNDITVTWDGDATIYHVSYRKASDNIVLGTFTPGTRSQLITALLNGVGYVIKIGNEKSGVTYEAEVQYMLPTICDPITNFQVDVAGTVAKLSWDPVASNPVYSVAAFELDKFGKTMDSEVYETSDTEFVLDNLKSCTKYMFRVFYECNPEEAIGTGKIVGTTDSECNFSPSGGGSEWSESEW